MQIPKTLKGVSDMSILARHLRDNPAVRAQVISDALELTRMDRAISMQSTMEHGQDVLSMSDAQYRIYRAGLSNLDKSRESAPEVDSDAKYAGMLDSLVSGSGSAPVAGNGKSAH